MVDRHTIGNDRRAFPGDPVVFALEGFLQWNVMIYENPETRIF